MKGKLYGVCLISASDIAKGLIPSDAVSTTNLVVVDSGCYEEQEGWSVGEYHEILQGIDTEANVIAVNFDRHGSIDDQIQSASEDFVHAPSAASDFLIKPTSKEEIVNIAQMRKYPLELSQFNAIGVAAREIGSSFLRRCQSVIMLRDILNEVGLDTPIHVFGAITPPELFTYFLCGADIFDGLNWLRFAYRKQGLLTMTHAATEDMKWNKHDYELKIEERTNNLRFLYNMQESMRQYCKTHDLSEIVCQFPIASDAIRIAEIAGAEI